LEYYSDEGGKVDEIVTPSGVTPRRHSSFVELNKPQQPASQALPGANLGRRAIYQSDLRSRDDCWIGRRSAARIAELEMMSAAR
jgi:hypothetical protein